MAELEQIELRSTDEALLSDLAPEISRLYNRHLEATEIWYPYQIAQEIREARANGAFETAISKEAESSMKLGLLTEEGLPYYTSVLYHQAKHEHPFSEWIRHWTAEEGRHGIVLSAALDASGTLNMDKTEDDRMAMMRGGNTPQPPSFADGIIYPTPQERATRLSHTGSARLLPNEYKPLKRAFTTVAGDENLHYFFYRDLSKAGFEAHPSTMTIAAARQIIYFTMPGMSIPGYARHAVRVSSAEIYGKPEELKIFTEILDFWDIEHLEGLTAEAEIARSALFQHIDKLRVEAKKTIEKREARRISKDNS